MLLGSLLSSYGATSIPRAGGDKIGKRRIDTHFINLGILAENLADNSNNGTCSVIPRVSLKCGNIFLD